MDLQDPLDLEAASLYDETATDGGPDFAIPVRDCVKKWRDRIYSSPSTDDPHFLTFSPYEPKVHEPVRQAMVEDAKKIEIEEEQVRTISVIKASN